MLNFAAGNPITGYNLSRSLRFRSSASASLSRTPSVTGNRQIFTYSAWVKRGTLDATFKNLFYAYVSTSDVSYISFNSSNQLTIAAYNGGSFVGELVTTQVFRDPSAWYHVVIAVDTTQVTASNRIKMYVNGSQITAFATATYPPQNTNFYFNAQYIHRIAASDYPATPNYFDGYLTEVNFIDGQALTPSSFGSYNSVSGVWQPARYTGTYGTNGFYLPFTDNSALTTSSNVGLGKDFSGNGNYWATNNISITSGVTYDSMTDVPTLTSATAANFAVLNPLNNNVSGTIKDGNLTYSNPSSGGYNTAVGSMAMDSGKYYWEVTVTTLAPSGTIIGISTASQSWVGGATYIGSTTTSYGYYNSGTKYNNGSATSYGASYTSGDVIGVALDLTAGTLVFYKNNTSQGTAFSSLSGSFVAGVSTYGNAANSLGVNFGQRPFAYTPPTGFVALNTYNLPTSTIVKGNTVMDATLYTGTLLSNAVTNAASFQPDLVWIKSRSAATDNKLTDSVRGVTKGLVSNSSAAETTDTQGLTAFNANGFTVGTNTTYNNLAATYVGWQWKANGAAASNTNGTITSSVSVNAPAGFSVVTYTGNGVTGATVGHGLGVAPSMVILKIRSSGANWYVYHTSIGATNIVYLDATNASAASSAPWNNTAPTSSVFTLGSAGAVNNNGSTFVAYCWAPIAGFSAFGSYTGNGSTDGPFVYLGFRPAYVMIKGTDVVSDWVIKDYQRANNYNPQDGNLYADLSNAEDTTASVNVDLLSNGFKLRGTYSGTNGPYNYIYMAFAQNPFKNSLAR